MKEDEMKERGTRAEHTGTETSGWRRLSWEENKSEKNVPRNRERREKDEDEGKKVPSYWRWLKKKLLMCNSRNIALQWTATEDTVALLVCSWF